MMKKLTSLALCIALLSSMLFSFSFEASAQEEREIYVGPDYIFEVINKSEVKLLNYIGTDDSVTTPTQIGGYPVKSIGEHAFFNTEIVNLTISEGIQTIDNEAFLYCQNLESVTLPTTLEETGSGVFKLCASLKEVTFKSAGINHNPYFGNNVFYGCTSLESVKLPSGLTGIYEGMFAYCHSLKNITLPDDLCVIFDWAFYDSGLTSITLPYEICGIGLGAFKNSKNLETVIVDERVLEILSGTLYIQEDAFEGCPSGNPFYPDHVDPPPYEEEFVTIFFKAGLDWETAYFYAHNQIGGESYPDSIPGKEMTYIKTDENGQDIYACNVPVHYDWVRFSDAGSDIRTTMTLPIREFIGENRNGIAIFHYEDGTFGQRSWNYDEPLPPDLEIPTYPLYQKFPEGRPFEEIIKDVEKEMSELREQKDQEIAEVMAVYPNVRYCGDANLNGDINIKDVTYIQKHIVGLVTLNETERKTADTTTDGKITVRDATLIQKAIALLATLPDSFVYI